MNTSKEKVSTKILAGVSLLLTIAVILLIFLKKPYFSYTSSMRSIYLNAFIMLIVALIQVNCALRNVIVINPKNHSFETMLTIECVALFCNTLLCFTDGHIEYRLLSLMICTIYRFCGTLVSAVFIDYANSFQPKEKTCVKKISLAICFGSALALILNFHFHFFFSVSKTGFYTIEKYYLFWYCFPFLIIICDFVRISKLRLKFNYKIVLYLYIVFPFCAMVIQETIPTNEILHPAITVSLIIIFVNIFVRQGEEIENNKRLLKEQTTQIIAELHSIKLCIPHWHIQKMPIWETVQSLGTIRHLLT